MHKLSEAVNLFCGVLFDGSFIKSHFSSFITIHLSLVLQLIFSVCFLLLKSELRFGVSMHGNISIHLKFK